MDKPAILGGKPIFNKTNSVPILRPALPDIKSLIPRLKKSFKTGQITNACNVREFERKAARYLDVKYCVAVSSCTAGLILVQKCLDLTGEVIVPSFTFHATAHSILWNNLKPVFVDCREDTFNIDEEKIEQLVTKKTSAILAVYIYGNPPAIEKLQNIAKRRKLKLIFDSAHAFGSKYNMLKAGRFGDAEIFSLSPTKLLIAGEGGIIATNDASLANKLKVARNYGDSGNYNCVFNGLNARMTEFNALLAMEGIGLVDKKIKRHNEIARTYTDFFRNYDGVSFQKIEDGNVSTYKDYSVIIDPSKFGIGRDTLAAALTKENIMTKKYFYPAVHKQQAYLRYAGKGLEVSERLSECVLSLPIYYSLSECIIAQICHGFDRIYRNRHRINRIFR